MAITAVSCKRLDDAKAGVGVFTYDKARVFYVVLTPAQHEHISFTVFGQEHKSITELSGNYCTTWRCLIDAMMVEDDAGKLAAMLEAKRELLYEQLADSSQR
ncbi:hypothetical protein ACFFNY_14740 [Paenibacillus hodogayensis]|uniref:MmcQ/YjbR family DNA-binding protein n=1 Tax=Paenibacillus hodogayensis TaxID=279208 RepID=A0ABV5VWX4_9BACL